MRLRFQSQVYGGPAAAPEAEAAALLSKLMSRRLCQTRRHIVGQAGQTSPSPQTLSA